MALLIRVEYMVNCNWTYILAEILISAQTKKNDWSYHEISLNFLIIGDCHPITCLM